MCTDVFKPENKPKWKDFDTFDDKASSHVDAFKLF